MFPVMQRYTLILLSTLLFFRGFSAQAIEPLYSMSTQQAIQSLTLVSLNSIQSLSEEIFPSSPLLSNKKLFYIKRLLPIEQALAISLPKTQFVTAVDFHHVLLPIIDAEELKIQAIKNADVQFSTASLSSINQLGEENVSLGEKEEAIRQQRELSQHKLHDLFYETIQQNIKTSHYGFLKLIKRKTFIDGMEPTIAHYGVGRAYPTYAPIYVTEYDLRFEIFNAQTHERIWLHDFRDRLLNPKVVVAYLKEKLEDAVKF